MKVLEYIIGNDFCLGSFAANYLQQGAGYQNPHLDYPYWDYNDKGSWRNIPKMGVNHTFFMNVQTLLMMDDFTVENGATAVAPFS